MCFRKAIRGSYASILTCIVFMLQESATPRSWSCPCWTSTTSWSWRGVCITCCSVSSTSCPGPAVDTAGTPPAAWRTPSARTKASGSPPTSPASPTSPRRSPNSGSEYRASSTGCVCTSLFSSLSCHLQTERPQHLFGDRRGRRSEVGSGAVPAGRLDHLLLLHLERSQIHWQGEEEDENSPLQRHKSGLYTFGHASVYSPTFWEMVIMFKDWKL